MSSTSFGTAADPPQRGWLATWFPVLAWGIVISMLSTSAFSSDKTAAIIDPILQWLMPDISGPAMSVCHLLVRKSAHFTEYGVLFFLLVRGPMARRPYVALALCLFYAMADEGHQLLVPGRGASLYDVALDSSGALFGNFLTLAIAEFA
ncbi:MAG: VanZ family protein [Candidatus Binatus sp.]|uniref:VanZ family protein n=1 Tax=Candidatus Binatus sp. TaxID=2811406 RepID=UPI0027278984|nr:VanZ family protein [Candidatus Binatus sp.]MDO8434410.1 VanZ family protein [Candidatus Binatus sp.]